MADVLLFHHVLGLTDGVRAFADELRAEGHTVHVPDLFEGRTFDSMDEGVAFVQQIGFGTVIERGVAAADDIGAGDGFVYAGLSLGVLPAQMLAQTRPGAAGALLLYSCVPVSEFSDSWPKNVRGQIHAMDADPSFVDEGDIDAARDLIAQAPAVELFLYPGDKHLFADSSFSDYDEAAAGLLLGRVLDFLS